MDKKKTVCGVKGWNKWTNAMNLCIFGIVIPSCTIGFGSS